MSLVLSGVGYRYAGATRPSLLDVDLELARGSVVGLAGASEAGKTTLCLVASGLAPRTVGGQIRGRISIDGQDIDGWPMHELSRRIAIGFQNPMTQMSQVAATVFEEVAFGPMNLALPRARGHRAHVGGTRDAEDRRACRTRPAAALRRAAAAGRHGGAAGHAARAPGPRRADRPARSCRDPAGGRCHLQARVRRRVASWSPSRRPISCRRSRREVVVLADGRVALQRAGDRGARRP